jgi:hypothetical protein
MVRTITEQLEHKFESGVNPEHAEGFIKNLNQANLSSTKVILRFEGYPYINPGVGWRIGNALRPYSGALEAVVPPLGKGDWFRTFTRSALGDAIAAHASSVRSEGEDITEKVKKLYYDQATRHDQNAVFFGELHRGVSVNPEREDLFREAFVRSLRKVNVSPTNFDWERLQDVVKLAYEAIQNVYDHAQRKPLPENTRIVSYFLLGYYKSISGHADPTGLMHGYIGRLKSLISRKRADFLQVCVNDDGVGIAARQSQNLQIYQGDIEDEEKAVRDALRSRSSVKLRTQDSMVRATPGEGYTYIDHSLRALRAFAVLRTGRLLAVFDGTDESGQSFELVRRDLGYMPGTALDVLVPIPKEGDGQPTLFPDE